MSSLHAQSAPPSGRSKHASKCVSAVWFAAIALLVLAACDTPGVTLIEPDVNAGPDSLTFSLHLEDSILADKLGWSAGVPDAVVMLHRIGEEFHPDSFRTDLTGSVTITGVIPGYYRIAAHRVLSGAESATAGTEVGAFGTGLKGQLSGSGSIELKLQSNQRGALVFSEIYPIEQMLTPNYQWFQYFELYNNSDTTLYLDGMIWGKAWHINMDFTTVPCNQTEAFRRDPLGIWAIFFHMFPGGGQEYPVEPGTAITVALDAVDHSVAHPAFPDLTRADFELEGGGDADNPDVPNMPQVGPRAWFRPHGLEVLLPDVIFLSQRVDPATLTRRHDAFTGEEWVLFPAELLLDVVSLHDGDAYADAKYTPCDAMVHPRFDRLEGGFVNTYFDTTTSIHRRMLHDPTSVVSIILHDVNASFIDLVSGPRTPGSVGR
ncbi:MAG: hypothetical protein JSW51_01680 [Gemmatimonadota bacterium]|nr:MAG: hypothetical protein JSW51_01680 [Gemmatimonadota bacterium]